MLCVDIVTNNSNMNHCSIMSQTSKQRNDNARGG